MITGSIVVAFHTTDTSVKDAEQLCPALALDPTGPYPVHCASFNQLGIRVPFIAVSPFSKPNYVSHTIGDHTSLLAMIEKRFLTVNGVTLHLTKRDQYANPLEDMFDFKHAPSLNTPVTQALPPANDCTPEQFWIRKRFGEAKWFRFEAKRQFSFKRSFCC
jgi:phospholipase C